jgi:hypothetical protein
MAGIAQGAVDRRDMVLLRRDDDYRHGAWVRQMQSPYPVVPRALKWSNCSIVPGAPCRAGERRP